jgi:hypothetical protein
VTATTAANEFWECRFVVREMPHKFTAERLAERLRVPLTPPIEESDVYLLTDDTSVNVKLRRRTNALKVKLLGGRSGDGLERWRTDIDSQLPAPASVWQAALRAVNVVDDASALGACAHFDAAVGALTHLAPALALVRVEKRRTTFQVGEIKLEVATFSVEREQRRSFAVESRHVEAIQKVLRTLDSRTLGQPTNYIEALNGMRR